MPTIIQGQWASDEVFMGGFLSNGVGMPLRYSEQMSKARNREIRYSSRYSLKVMDCPLLINLEPPLCIQEHRFLIQEVVLGIH